MKINDIFKNKITKRLYVLVEFENETFGNFLNLEDKYNYTIPYGDMELWYESL